MSRPDPSAELHETAAEWFLRRRDAGWTPADEADFANWLAADPAHRQIYASFARTWDDFAQVRRPALAAKCAPRRNWLARLFDALPAPAVAAACVMLAVGGWFGWNNIPHYSAELATAHGQTGQLDLPDGSRIVLNMDSQVQVRYYPRRREIVLGQGEAFFRVELGPERPFTVRTGRSEVRVVGTAFNVRATPPRLIVKVLDGVVEVRPDTAADQPPLRLTAQQGLTFDQTGNYYQTFAPQAESIGDWRAGQLVFRRAPLSEVADDIARYLGQPVELRGSSLAGLSVSGYATTRAPQAFLESLPELLPVRVQRQRGGGYVITRR